MTFSRRSFLTLAAGLPLAACATVPPSPSRALPITLVDAFQGRTRGTGVFRAPLAGIERRFTADLVGRVRRDRLTVVEDFRYDDGQEDRLTWVFIRTGPGTWDGRREDTVGPATVVEDGREIRLTYQADFRSTEGVTRLGFADVIYRPSPDLVVNDAVVTRWGLPVGTVRFELRRA
ncbi:MAG: DUF3833 domain-containing protein [Rhodobacteraceae bacterium]|jgi:hypothetical protein|nr:DUF3833 domain-containing protein [Paracoccaceae bacterium]